MLLWLKLNLEFSFDSWLDFTLSLIQINHYFQNANFSNYLKDLSVSVTYKWSTWSKAILLKVRPEGQQYQHTWELVREGKTRDFLEIYRIRIFMLKQDPQAIHIHLRNLKSSDPKHRNFRNCFEFYLLKSFQQTFLWHHRSSKPRPSSQRPIQKELIWQTRLLSFKKHVYRVGHWLASGNFRFQEDFQ